MISLDFFHKFVVIVASMSKKIFLMLAIFLAAVATTACNYPGYSSSSSQPAVTSMLPAPLDPNQVVIDPDCAWPLAAGDWAGNLSSQTTASALGVRVIDQIAQISLEIEVSCAGDVQGSATRTGSVEVRVPFTLDGNCIENVQYQVSGFGRLEQRDSPALHLTFTAQQGSLTCNLDSNHPSIPDGEQTKDLVGSTFSMVLTPDISTPTWISGSQWTDTFYQDQFSGIQQVMDEYGVVPQTINTWEFKFLY